MTTLLKDLPKEDLPRERLIAYGPECLSNEELLAILFRTGTKGASAKDLSNKVLSYCKDTQGLKDLTFNTLNKIKGLGPTKSVTLLASLELGKRIFEEPTPMKKVKVLNTVDAVRLFGKYIKHEHQENFLAIFLDVHGYCISHKIIFKGTLNESIVHPREVFREAVLESASAIIIMHNHPSGITTPSKNDDNMTHVFLDVGAMMDIQVLDHIIVSENGYYSYLEEGRIRYAET